MSIHKHRERWQVKYRDEQGRQRGKSFDRKRDAEAYEAKVRLAKRAGRVDDLDAGLVTFSAFTEEWWKLHGNSLAPKTQEVYRGLLKNHLLPAFGRMELRRITTRSVSELQAKMLKNGVGRETVRKSLALLQGMLERAVEWGRLPANPVRSVKKPPQGRSRAVSRIEPKTVEEIRRSMIERGLLRDATMVSLLAYAGLRPGEILALTWNDVGEKTLSVTKAVSLGETRTTKTRRDRTVLLLKPLADDLAAWRKASGAPSAGEALMFPKRTGSVWTDSDYRNWRTRHYVPRAREAGIDAPRPYDLRHSFASLMFVEQRNPLEIARWMGHSPDVLFRVYAGLIPELEGAEKQSAAVLIEDARRSSCSPNVPPTTSS